MLEDQNSGIRQRTLTQGVVRELREQLLSGKIKGGEPLKQEKIAREFGVSRIPVREALLQLGAEGLIVFKPHKGAVANEFSIEEANELFHLRALLEVDLLSSAFSELSKAVLRQAEEALVRYEYAIEKTTEVDTWSELNWTFHRILYEPAKLPRTMLIVRNLHTSTDRYQRVYLRSAGIGNALIEHRAILNLCLSRKKAAALKSLEDHILSVHGSVREILGAKGEVKLALTAEDSPAPKISRRGRGGRSG
jgi:DNA-binding GntR family transcriptional regulator